MIGLYANFIGVVAILPNVSDHFHGSRWQYNDGFNLALLVSIPLVAAVSLINVALDISRCERAGDKVGIKLALLGLIANVAVAVGLIILGFIWLPEPSGCDMTSVPC